MTSGDEPISSEAGQALIRLAAEAAAAGDYDRAIAAQRQAVEMAGRLFGDDSDENAIATVNLGSLYFRAQRPAEAFDSYRDGLERLFARGAASDLHGQALDNLLASGMTAGRTAETGQALLTLAKYGKAWPGSINLAKPAAMAFVTAPQWAKLANELALPAEAAIDAAAEADAPRPELSLAASARALADDIKGSIISTIDANADAMPDVAARRDELTAANDRYLFDYRAPRIMASRAGL